MENEITVKEFVAEKLMIFYGWPVEERENNLEWDPNHPDSQYSILLDVSEAAIEATMEALSLISEESVDQFPQQDQDSVIRSSETTYLFLEPTERYPLTVGDVRDWLEEAKAMGAPDNFTVEGSLHLMFDQNNELISREHPSVISKEESRIFQLEIDTARKKIDYLVKQGNYAEAEKIISFIRKREEQEDDS